MWIRCCQYSGRSPQTPLTVSFPPLASVCQALRSGPLSSLWRTSLGRLVPWKPGSIPPWGFAVLKDGPYQGWTGTGHESSVTLLQVRTNPQADLGSRAALQDESVVVPSLSPILPCFPPSFTGFSWEPSCTESLSHCLLLGKLAKIIQILLRLKTLHMHVKTYYILNAMLISR